ncbi:aminodeoxychorismate lyase [Paramixta manurensis]|uniref:Aminodeoxychorismate lyase n=1 Tax=Paramixta manurensis TaxID=2740817 RepID=A0A6M8U7S0_9GAMM|nr:aminodeoxychorismate lyase [Erwiniaceae bacterium PD-1]
MVWINGEARDSLAANDRGVQFGDGCFTTARIRDGGVAWLAAHLARLQEGCRRLAIANVAWQKLEQEMQMAASTRQEGVLKVILTRGSGGRGYSSAGCQQPTRIISLADYPAHYHQWRETGIRLATSPVRLAINPLLAGIKHLNRLEQVLIRTQLEQTGAQEALVLDTNGKLVECCAANLFWRKEKSLFTPRIDGAGVNGIMRQHILRLAPQYGFRCEEVSADPTALAEAEEVLVCNALMPVLPVCQIDEQRFTDRQFFHLISSHC